MRHAAYQRGSMTIRRQIDVELRARPQAAEGFARDYSMHAVLRLLKHPRAAAVLEAIERTYDEARAAGLTADNRGMYRLALARHRARRADPGAAPRGAT